MHVKLEVIQRIFFFTYNAKVATLKCFVRLIKSAKNKFLYFLHIRATFETLRELKFRNFSSLHPLLRHVIPFQLFQWSVWGWIINMLFYQYCFVHFKQLLCWLITKCRAISSVDSSASVTNPLDDDLTIQCTIHLIIVPCLFLAVYHHSSGHSTLNHTARSIQNVNRKTSLGTDR